jgi:hypothetical protein
MDRRLPQLQTRRQWRSGLLEYRPGLPAAGDHVLAAERAGEMSMIPKKPAPDLIRGGYRFPACAKPLHAFSLRLEASAGEGRSEKIMLH